MGSFTHQTSRLNPILLGDVARKLQQRENNRKSLQSLYSLLLLYVVFLHKVGKQRSPQFPILCSDQKSFGGLLSLLVAVLPSIYTSMLGMLLGVYLFPSCIQYTLFLSNSPFCLFSIYVHLIFSLPDSNYKCFILIDHMTGP